MGKASIQANLKVLKHMDITGLTRRLSLIGIETIWLLRQVCVLIRIIASFLHYTVYLGFINNPINRVLLLMFMLCYRVVYTFDHSDLNYAIKYYTIVYERNGENFVLFKVR